MELTETEIIGYKKMAVARFGTCEKWQLFIPHPYIQVSTRKKCGVWEVEEIEIPETPERLPFLKEMTDRAIQQEEENLKMTRAYYERHNHIQPIGVEMEILNRTFSGKR